jgi:hypothetical protein
MREPRFVMPGMFSRWGQAFPVLFLAILVCPVAFLCIFALYLLAETLI